MTKRSLLPILALVGVLAPEVASAATPLQGVPVDIRRGFYTETDLGTFFTLGGQGASPSNGQAYVALGLGYDLFAKNKSLFSLGLAITMGTSAGACFGATYAPGSQTPCLGQTFDQTTQSNTVLSDNWTATTVEGSALYGYQIANRLFLTGRIIGGLAFIQPKAFEGFGDQLPIAGLGLGLEWATEFDHFSLGLDAAGKMFVGPNKLGLAIAPRIKYTF